jgi:hypothetical protein
MSRRGDIGRAHGVDAAPQSNNYELNDFRYL